MLLLAAQVVAALQAVGFLFQPLQSPDFSPGTCCVLLEADFEPRFHLITPLLNPGCFAKRAPN